MATSKKIKAKIEGDHVYIPNNGTSALLLLEYLTESRLQRENIYIKIFYIIIKFTKNSNQDLKNLIIKINNFNE